MYPEEKLLLKWKILKNILPFFFKHICTSGLSVQITLHITTCQCFVIEAFADHQLLSGEAKT